MHNKLNNGVQQAENAEMSTDQDWIRTEANFGRIGTGSQ